LFGKFVVFALVQHGHGFLDEIVNLVVFRSMTTLFAMRLFLLF
jgi:hypothetical protein